MSIKNIFYLVLVSILIYPGNAALCQTGKELDYYIALNEREQRLSEYRDDDESLKLKLKQLEIINKSRARFKAPPVKLDILASRVANKMSREAAENGYVSHWNLSGEKPYHRYAFAGGHDHVTENAYGEWTSGRFESSGSTISSMMKKGHGSFMAERAPADGHKRTIIDKRHNYVGIGYHLTENQFRYYEEFIKRYLDFHNVPATVKVDEEFKIQVDTKGGAFLFFLICYYEKMLTPAKPGQKPRKGSYEDFSGEVALRLPAWELSGYRQGTIYSIPLRFSKEGLYYIQIFTDPREKKTPGKITTKGRSPVSGIVIRALAGGRN